MAVFFSQVGYKPTREWKEECVFWDPLHTSNPAANVARREGAKGESGRRTRRAPCRWSSPRAADRGLSRRNKVRLSARPRSAGGLRRLVDHAARIPGSRGAIVNRVWYWLLGRGIIHEPDDIRDDNPPSNPALLAYLEKELIAEPLRSEAALPADL